MGIRMQLAVGYGLKLSDHPHLNKDCLNYDSLEDPDKFAAWRRAVLGYAQTYDDLMEKMIMHDSMKPAKDLADMVVYMDEFGDEDRLVLIPSGYKSTWQRGGNHLDAFLYEAQVGNYDDLDLLAEWLPHPGTLYPNVGLMKPNPEMPLGIEKYWVPCYKNHPDHKDAIAWAPWHLYFLIRHLFDISDEQTTETFLALRPGVYRYWC
jgi:hypothetical protein